MSFGSLLGAHLLIEDKLSSLGFGCEDGDVSGEGLHVNLCAIRGNELF